ncbi:tripartite tricarboxylate transporter substrate binding protein BugE [Caenimonas soli]|uniref:tripartite tricarboxylate transporter substrate binding protein BugE n=1 Tax=Caenimonas soli TaxID=2735555 RepID=UPI001555FB69|nr:tripartite tricarboxylate transporter substrate binding protein BugE [Caenimonas soli]NPC57908.1 tripartite tricarboxylate transporter substrate binding protein BugE [Caenimonas soli]
MLIRRTFIRAGAAALALPLAPFARAQAFPSKPIRLLVPFAPGGTTDLLARILAERMAPLLGQPVIVENKSGGGGTVGAAEVARAAPDGYLLCMVTASTAAAGPALNPKIPYHPVTDFTPIINVAATPNVIAAHTGFPARNFEAFLGELKRRPGRYSYASAGTGSLAHLQMELFKSLSGTFIAHIPYRGGAPALNDTVAGQTAMILDNLPTALPFITAGRLNPIVVSAPARTAQLPEVPTFKEVGMEPMNRMGFFGIEGPRGMRKDVVDRISDAAGRALLDPATRKRIEATGSVVVSGTPEQFGEQIRTEYELYRQVVAKQKLSPD